MIRSAPSRFAEKSVISKIMSTPVFNSALRNAANPAPKPPAAPAPGRSFISLPSSFLMIQAKCSRLESNNLICSGLAPFCAPYTKAEP